MFGYPPLLNPGKALYNKCIGCWIYEEDPDKQIFLFLRSKSFPEGRDACGKAESGARSVIAIVDVAIELRKRKTQPPTNENTGGKKLWN